MARQQRVILRKRRTAFQRKSTSLMTCRGHYRRYGDAFRLTSVYQYRPSLLTQSKALKDGRSSSHETEVLRTTSSISSRESSHNDYTISAETLNRMEESKAMSSSLTARFTPSYPFISGISDHEWACRGYANVMGLLFIFLALFCLHCGIFYYDECDAMTSDVRGTGFAAGAKMFFTLGGVIDDGEEEEEEDEEPDFIDLRLDKDV